MGANWAPRTATRAGPASANVTLVQVEMCDLITRKLAKRVQATTQSNECVALNMELNICPRWQQLARIWTHNCSGRARDYLF